MAIAAEQQSFYLVLLSVLLLVQPVAADDDNVIIVAVVAVVACLKIALLIFAIYRCVKRCKLRQEEAARQRFLEAYVAIVAESINRQGNMINVDGNSATSTRANPAIYSSTIQPPPPGFVYEWPNVSNDMKTVPESSRSADNDVCLIDAAVPPSYNNVAQANSSALPSYSEA